WGPALPLAGEEGEPATVLLRRGARGVAGGARLVLGPAIPRAHQIEFAVAVGRARAVALARRSTRDSDPGRGEALTCPVCSRDSPRRCGRWRRALRPPPGSPP